MNYNSLTYKMFRYLIQALAIFLIFKFLLPEIGTGDQKIKLGNADVLLITVVIMLIYILFENVCCLYGDDNDLITDPSKLTSSEKNELCNTVCAVKQNGMNHEPMTNIANQNGAIANQNGGIANQNCGIANQNGANANQNGANANHKRDDKQDHKQDKAPVINNQCNTTKENFSQELSLMEEFVSFMQNKKKNINTTNATGNVTGNATIKQNNECSNDYFPMASGHDSQDYEYGYSYLPPSQWYPPNAIPPVCITDKQCAVCPVYTTGTPVDVKEWHDSCKVTPIDNTNIDYSKKQ